MALKATIYKAIVNIADLDRSLFLKQALTLARHPSETENRLMLRLLAWICHADEQLRFTRGLSAGDEPEIWRLNDNSEIELWIELGLPDEKRIKKACSKAQQVYIYAYQERAASAWWQQFKPGQYTNLTIRFLDDRQLNGLTTFASRAMDLQATLQDGIIWLSDQQQHLEICFKEWQ